MKKLLKRPEGICAVAAMACGFLAHVFALVHLLHNYDNILQQPRGYGAGITSGRWLLEVLGDINDTVVQLNFNLSVMNGLGFLLFIALSAALIVNILKIRNHASAILLGCLMATFPTVAATLVFRYTAPYYGLSLLLAVLAVWLTSKGKLGFVFSAVCLACSMGIYQAYAPFAISLFVLALMRESLEPEVQLPALIRRGLYYCFTLVLGVLLYFVFLKLFLALYSMGGEVALDSYQGINTMGKISLAELPGLVKDAWLSAALFPVKDYCGITIVRPLKVLWLLLVMIILAQSVFILWKNKVKPLNAAFYCLMGLLFPLAINFIVVMAPQGIVYTIMVYSFVLVGWVPLMLLEYMPDAFAAVKLRTAKITGLLLAGIIVYNAYYANVNYTSLYYANRQVENFVNGLVTQARMTEGYTIDKQWIIIGQIDKFMLYDVWYETPYYGGFIGSTAQGLVNTAYSRGNWFGLYLGRTPQFAPEEARLRMQEKESVALMPNWPDLGSVQVIDDYVVVKLSDPVS